MEFSFKQVENENLVYIKEGNFIFIAKFNEKVYCPNFSFVCISNPEMAIIKNLVETVKTNGTSRLTNGGKTAMDGGNDIYDISIITLDNGKLIDISFKDNEHPLSGLSFKYIEQANGAVALTQDQNFTYFPPNGNTSFSLGFSKKKVKVGTSFYDKIKKGFVTTYSEDETFLTVPNQGNSEGFLRAYKGMKLLDSATEFALKHMTPVVGNSNVDQDLVKAVGANIPF